MEMTDQEIGHVQFELYRFFKDEGEALPTDPLNSYMAWRDLSPDAKEYLLLLATLHSADHHIWFCGPDGPASCAFCGTPMPLQ
ncbi:MAG: hypothetical protein OXF41_00500 [bacterium]|nr:hypothetical protein [bacterium]